MSLSSPDSNRSSDRPPAEIILGFLNFSTGRPEPMVQAAFNALFTAANPTTWDDVRSLLDSELDRLVAEQPAFRDAAQARETLACVFDELLPGYFRHHADLLFHLGPNDLLNPFFLARLCEAVLAAGPEPSERDRVVAEALTRLNDFVGHRPQAILEKNHKAEVYPHERYRPVPLYLRDAGVAVGPYREIIAATLEHLEATPADLLEESSFDLARLDELAVDVRAHDALHPVFKRTNYLFGEWDPHLIDNDGHFRRFVVRRIILDSLCAWMGTATDLPPAERLHDASAVLCGTILMATAISGWGPAAHDSTVSLTSLLPVVAHQRDMFYTRLMKRMSGRRAARLAAVAESTRQPFGHVRQHLNISLANYAAAQMQHRAIAEQYAKIGYFEAAREEAARIPAASVRFECELDLRVEAAVLSARQNGPAAAERLIEAQELLTRGIECGAVIDPWNILGFQGQFPLFVAREDAVPDPRAEWLIDYMGRLFAAGGRVLTEAAAVGDAATAARMVEWLEQMASWWDKYATTTVGDLPSVQGRERTDSAAAVASTIAEWRAAGRAAGDLSFWQQRVDRLETPQSFGEVVEALLARGDFVASSGLLIQWISQADDVGLGEGPQSFFGLSIRWLRELTSGPGAPPAEEQARLCRRFFDFLEANAGEFWTLPSLGDPLLDASDLALESTAEEYGDEDDEGEDDLFGAAYEDVVYRDSTADNFESSVLDSPTAPSGGEFEARLLLLEPRLRFLDVMGQLWRFAAGRIDWPSDAAASSVPQWRQQALEWQAGLSQLATAIARHPLGIDSGDLDANVEFDAQLQSKHHLLYLVTGAAVRMASAERLLRSRCGEPAKPDGDDAAIRVLRPLLAGDVVGVRTALPPLLQWLVGQPLLYVAVENGGDPGLAIAARVNQDLLTLLVAELPRLGLLHEAHEVLRTALRMERRSRPTGMSITEFDRLFRGAFDCVLRTAVNSRAGDRIRWNRRRSLLPQRSGHPRIGRVRGDRRTPDSRHRSVSVPGKVRLRGRNRATVSLVGRIVEQYLDLWLQHASTMRLSAVEVFNDSNLWSETRRFIHRYGGELFHARSLPLSNLRAILHEGVEVYLEHLVEQSDPLHPSPLVDALENDDSFRRRAVRLLELIYPAVVDEIERFIEYNSTTTQSDYGERFDSFLDFLRAEAAYRRDEWDLTPLRIAHEVLASMGEGMAARLWEEVVRVRTTPIADKHQARLAALEKRHAMRLPSISDHFAERFVKPLAVDRMLALVPMAVRDARGGQVDSPAFRMLRREIDAYIATSTGSAAELPDWIGKINVAVSRAVDGRSTVVDERDTVTGRPIPRLRRGQVLRQFARSQPVRRRKS